MTAKLEELDALVKWGEAYMGHDSGEGRGDNENCRWCRAWSDEEWRKPCPKSPRFKAAALLRAQAEEIARKDAALTEIARQDFGGLQGIAEDHRFDAEDYDKETALAKLQAWHDEENVYLMGRIAHRRSVARAALGGSDA